MRHITIGILAHVDAGKTTLSEAFLYSCGAIRKLGRVDHRDAFLDTFSMERERGITIFSKQAELDFPNDLQVTLLDTPGHVDFSAEMERCLQVLDYAVLVISGADGVQSHTRTLWRLLERYHVPVFLFVNKMDQVGTDHDRLYRELQSDLNDNCVELLLETVEEEREAADRKESGQEHGRVYSDREAMYGKLSEQTFEAIATCEDTLLNEYLETGTIQESGIARAIADRKLFPCIFGSALHLDGVEDLIQVIARYAGTYFRSINDDFGAVVYKITRDKRGARLTHMKITSGVLKVKAMVDHKKGEPEKVDQIRIYSGDSYTQVSQADAGMICAVTGLEHSYCGEGLGASSDSDTPVLEPVLMYQMLVPEDVDVHRIWNQLKELEEENPLLHMTWEETSGEIQIQVMGEVELEILRAMIEERYGLSVSFGQGSLVYKETIRNTVEGIGHYEPLKHYAEVHLLMEPGEAGTGIQIESRCSEDQLDRNWQRLIMTHIGECRHPGVLTGSELTDVRITVLNGRAHTKHTEGGDFRQATYRAIRQGLMQADNVLLEPVYEYRLELPRDLAGRAISDIQRMNGSYEGPDYIDDMAVLTGIAPAASMLGYQKTVQEYTHGLGRFFCNLHGYLPCHNTEEVLEKTGYDPEMDVAHPSSSVFCAHGAGYLVPWDEVENYMHLERSYIADEDAHAANGDMDSGYGAYGTGAGTDSAFGMGHSEGYGQRTRSDNKRKNRNSQTGSGSSMSIGEDEIREIMERTYGVGSMDRKFYNRESWEDYDPAYDSGAAGMKDVSGTAEKDGAVRQGDPKYRKRQTPKKDAYLLVDGYNIIFAWDELKSIADTDLGAARDRLMDIMCNYQGYRDMNLILVFDAYKVTGNPGTAFDYHNIHIVYTKEAQTADQYIEKFVHETGKTYDITVATSDGLEQLIVMGAGATRLSARNLLEEVEQMEQELREKYLKKK